MKLRDLLSTVSPNTSIRCCDNGGHMIGQDRLTLCAEFGDKEVEEVWVNQNHTLIIYIKFEQMTVEQWLEHMNATMEFKGDRLVITPLGGEPIEFVGTDQIFDIVVMARQDSMEWAKEEK